MANGKQKLEFIWVGNMKRLKLWSSVSTGAEEQLYYTLRRNDESRELFYAQRVIYMYCDALIVRTE